MPRRFYELSHILSEEKILIFPWKLHNERTRNYAFIVAALFQGQETSKNKGQRLRKALKRPWQTNDLIPRSEIQVVVTFPV